MSSIKKSWARGSAESIHIEGHYLAEDQHLPPLPHLYFEHHHSRNMVRSRCHRNPTCLLECYDDSKERMDPYLFFQYRRSQRMALSKLDHMKMVAMCYELAKEEAAQQAKAGGNTRKQRGEYETAEQRFFRDPVDGTIRRLGPRETAWYQNYVSDPHTESAKFRKKFRRRFRCSHPSFVKHVAEVKESDLFKAWSDTASNCAGVEASPIELLVLGALRYLGRGWCHDDIEEQTCISAEVHRQFLHVYLLWGSTTLFDKYVTLPASGAEAMKWASEYAMAGFHGCMGSMDATHVGMLKCPYKLKQFNDSWKLNLPSRTYNTTVVHTRKIIYSTPGHPGRWNDKTLQLFDKLAHLLREGKRYADVTFTLWRRDGNAIRGQRYRGPWLLVDNGYLAWPFLVPPSKLSLTYPEMRFSRWVESLRKDVECTFGIMKGRFRILKTGVPLHGVAVCDRVWLTCCALHNFLLEEDGLNETWDASQYLYREGGHDERDVYNFLGARTHRDLLKGMYDYDQSGMGMGTDIEAVPLDDVSEQDDTDDDEPGRREIPVHKMRLADFKERLIEHFDILWSANQIRWPSRTGSLPPEDILERFVMN